MSSWFVIYDIRTIGPGFTITILAFVFVFKFAYTLTYPSLVYFSCH